MDLITVTLKCMQIMLTNSNITPKYRPGSINARKIPVMPDDPLLQPDDH